MILRSFLLYMWSLLDPFYFALNRLAYVESGRIGNIFRVRLLRYRGHPITLSDGTCIRRGDVLVKIHLHNVKLLKLLFKMRSDIEKGKCISRVVQASLPGLASYVERHPKSAHIKGIIGVTLLHKGSRLLGFETFPIQSPWYNAFKWVSQTPLYFICVSQPIRTFRKQSIRLLLMPKSILMQRYSE